MTAGKRKDDGSIEELRRLLLGDELDKLEQVHTHVEIPENFSSQVGEILPEAMIKSSEQGEALSEAMVPTVEEIVRLSIRKDINRFADALFPVIGPAIRKAIRETIRQMLQTLNRTLEHSFSWQGLQWRLQSMRTGIPFAQIALLHGLVYRVEQVFLIHRDTGLLLCHRELDDIQNKSPDLVSSMLAAINDFVGDSFDVESERTLDSIEVGELSIWIEPGPDVILAVAIRGEAPASLRTTLQETLEEIHQSHGDALADFSGDTGYFSARPEILDACLQAQYRGGSGGISAKTVIVILLIFAGLAWWVGHSVHRSILHTDYVELLRAEPGYVITAVSESDGRLTITGLRDPLSREPGTLEFPPRLAQVQADLRLRPYQSLEADFVEQRARQVLQPPESVVLSLVDGRLVASGIADAEWQAQLRRTTPLIAGIDQLDDSGLRTQFHLDMLNAPDSVTVSFEDAVLYLEGAAEQGWIASLDDIVANHPEVRAVDSRALVNLTEVELVEQIAALEREIVLFDVATSFDFDSFDEPRITQLVSDIVTGSRKLSRNVLINVRGYSDSVGSQEDNEFLSRERAEFVAQAIVNTGINPRYLAIRAMGGPAIRENSEVERRRNRRVDFEVTVE